MAAIQAHAADFVAGDHETMLLNFPRGFQLDDESGRLSFDWMPRSSFHSLFERPGEDLTTVLAGNHSKFHELHRTVHDDSIPAWLMVIHGGNVINSLREYYTGDAERKRLAEFGLSDAALASPVDGAGAEAQSLIASTITFSGSRESRSAIPGCPGRLVALYSTCATPLQPARSRSSVR